ncbi:PD-(D/E)XK nuclease family protein [Funiculus sociatus GB2-A5]|uniref:PD-(D/E)XK nuclease family protein n=1 Tax=Funiculus sociatus GB2-A5 TaxID=2933946 RepID=A0ABV0JRN1_9CYAN|nr:MULTISPECIES: PD-(D/E)XK nuclease family protein [unclassified Trichocoleus]MBD1905034.1 PD-(D/E)XK nuclease family protein [Trichocoleus sp. FACHB-832]MBD2064104.1 PD-(D/E)XK nuclease family protein [Trichocoleus sp. FACHB-6]
MQLNQETLLRLSQGQLNLLETCPRRFQHIYLDKLSSPTHPEQQERLTWGSRFHLLMQQRELGLPVESLVQEDAQLQRWVNALLNAAPELLKTDSTFRQSEHCRTLNFQGYLLTVIYDLLIEDVGNAQIFDWKTHLQPKKRQWLEADWQTRLYLYVLTETSDYLVEQVSMTYWFVQSQPEPKSIKIQYNARKHEQTEKDLKHLLTQLTEWLQRYQDGVDFPQVLESANRCGDCNFAVRCDRVPIATHLRTDEENPINRDLLLNIANIQEVYL